MRQVPWHAAAHISGVHPALQFLAWHGNLMHMRDEDSDDWPSAHPMPASYLAGLYSRVACLVEANHMHAIGKTPCRTRRQQQHQHPHQRTTDGTLLSLGAFRARWLWCGTFGGRGRTTCNPGISGLLSTSPLPSSVCAARPPTGAVERPCKLDGDLCASCWQALALPLFMFNLPYVADYL